MTPDEPDPLDVETAAYHEAGHAVAATVAGGCVVYAEIFRPEKFAGGVEARTVVGKCHYAEQPPHAAVVGLAGAAAETVFMCLRDGDDLSTISSDDLCDSVLADGSWSETDRAFLGDADPEAAARDAIALVVHHWPAVEATAALLISHLAATGNEIWKVVRRRGASGVTRSEPGDFDRPLRAESDPERLRHVLAEKAAKKAAKSDGKSGGTKKAGGATAAKKTSGKTSGGASAANEAAGRKSPVVAAPKAAEKVIAGAAKSAGKAAAKSTKKAVTKTKTAVGKVPPPSNASPP